MTQSASVDSSGLVMKIVISVCLMFTFSALIVYFKDFEVAVIATKYEKDLISVSELHAKTSALYILKLAKPDLTFEDATKFQQSLDSLVDLGEEPVGEYVSLVGDIIKAMEFEITEDSDVAELHDRQIKVLSLALCLKTVHSHRSLLFMARQKQDIRYAAGLFEKDKEWFESVLEECRLHIQDRKQVEA